MTTVEAYAYDSNAQWLGIFSVDLFIVVNTDQLVFCVGGRNLLVFCVRPEKYMVLM